MKLIRKQRIGSYVVEFPLSESQDCASCRARGSDGRLHFLKCTRTGSDSPEAVRADVTRRILHAVRHPGLPVLQEDFTAAIDGAEVRVDVIEFVGGENLAELVEPVDVTGTFLKLLAVVQALHEKSVLLRNLGMADVILDFNAVPPEPRIVRFGGAVFGSTAEPLPEGRHLALAAPEVLNRQACSPASDVFSLGCILYGMLYGEAPWSRPLPEDPAERPSAIAAARRERLRLDDSDAFLRAMNAVLRKALALDPKERFGSAEAFRQALSASMEGCPADAADEEPFSPEEAEKSGKDLKPRRKGNGFADVAGMTALKQQLQSDVIDLLREPEKARNLGLHVPNGLLMYGPPGCGKTFFAEKFAEELGCWYRYVKCSDIASPYIHGGQDKIAALFREAARHAPAILFFDEIEVMIRDRRLQNNTSEAGEVNEFLTQLNNCGQRGIIAIGATNRPDQLDPAALRAGRLEYRYYIPLPDRATRKAIFEVSLRGRNSAPGIDCGILADRTEGCVSADIRLIVDKAARFAFRCGNDRIAFPDLLKAIAETRPSVPASVIAECERSRDRLESA